MRTSKYLLIFCALLLVSCVQVVSAEGGYTYVTQWNSTNLEGLNLDLPSSLAVDSTGNVYVADSGNGQILKFNSSGTCLPWGDAGLGTPSFVSPMGIAVDSTGNVYVTDSGNGQILKFDSNGTSLSWKSPNPFSVSNFLPGYIAVDSVGNIYVTNPKYGQVLKFDSSGNLTSWDDPENPNLFAAPLGVAVDSADHIYITDIVNHRVLKFDSSGKLIPWGQSDLGDLAGHPTAIDVDSAGNIYVTDSGIEIQFGESDPEDMGNQWVQKFSPSGDLIAQWGSSGSEDGQFIFALDIAVDGAGNVFVADTYNNRIQKFSPDTPPAPAITAGFYAFGHVGQAPYSVRFLDQSAGSPTAWTWDFGDGSTSTEQSPTHLFNCTGAFNVALNVSNDQASDTSIQYRCIIVNTVPMANFTANATAGSTPFTVQFTDQSSDANGYQWQFGDGTTSTDQNPVHTYTQPGSYTVTLVVSSADYGSVYTQKPGYITVTDPPTVGFSANATAGLSPLAVQFNESTTGSVQYFYWQFGDGSTSYDQNPVHVYDKAGKYTVSLYAIGSNGTQVKTVENYINVTAPVTPAPTTPTPVNTTATVTPTSTPTEQSLPVANFTVTPQGTPGSIQILVTDTAVNATSVRYDLGDGTTTEYPNFRYTYSQAGTYTIKQTAINAAGSSTKNITVTVPIGSPTPPTTPTVSPTATTSAGSAYNGPHNLPGILQAEDYDLGGEGVAYQDTTAGNEGGIYRQDDVDIETLDTDGSPNIGWIRAGEWLTYTVNISTAGTYDAGFRVASSHTGSSVQVYVDDGTTPVATVTVPNTGDWPIFRTVSVPVTLPAGQHRLSLLFPTDYVNINWISFPLRP